MTAPRDADGSSRAWQRDHPWAFVYDRISGDSRVGALLWRIGVGSGVDVLHRLATKELARLEPGSTVIDIPCGGGIVLRDLPQDHGLRYLAADISPAMLERTRSEARRRGLAGIETTEMDVGDLPLDDGSVELVLAFTSLHCFPDPRAAVAEMARVLAPGGRVALSTILTDTPWPYRGVWPVGRAAGVLGPGCSGSELRAWSAASGLVDIDLRAAGGLAYLTATRD
ncbi:class I SAM-dependent methyltransferase [Aeromicrobium sp. Leaf350]|uniref:class I SAM-dependent methyltransferase n=1 Tax=Aeromicrobium sp. Leaf350 TaxID=2876565 RepID=UPI001E5D8C4F|nr:class I SAM-dependent methyltransferase [Aeromicrobium sp. Leaf350]